jgi:ATP-dependent Clp protease ATP-binding subunit ClpB
MADTLKLIVDLQERQAAIKDPIITEAVTPEDIAEVVAKWTGIPVKRMLESEREKLLRMEDQLHKRVVGQNEAIEAVSDAVRRSRAGLQNEKRPIGSFLFMGTTGVGKTEFAKALAEALYGSEDALIRLDMSEYCEAHSISRLIGSPPGYIGYDEGGQLCEKVRINPHHIILFDEIEKAHRDIFNLMLQIMDEGILCDSRGRKISFKNTVIIMTSNIASIGKGSSSNPLGFVVGGFDGKSYVTDKLREVFSSEFLSRPDEIIVFNALNRDTILKISENMLKKLEKRISANENISVRFDSSMAQHIADLAKCENGARDVRRALMTEIETPLSLLLLEKQVSPNGLVLASFKNGNIIFECQEKNEKWQ